MKLNIKEITSAMEAVENNRQELKAENEQLKEENGKFTDTLDVKDEEIQKLTTQLTQKSNEVDIHQSRLSQDMNGLRSKLRNREKQNEELKEQIDQSKLNALETKDNKIALLEVKVEELESSTSGQMDEFMKCVNKVGYVKHRIMIGHYKNKRPKYKTCFLPEDIVQHLTECPQFAAAAILDEV